jgi:hypothetical protein
MWMSEVISRGIALIASDVAQVQDFCWSWRATSSNDNVRQMTAKWALSKMSFLVAF